MARTFQNIRLFGGMTVVENIMVGAYTRLKQNAVQTVLRTEAFKDEEARAEARAEELMEYVGLHGRRQRARRRACPTAPSAAWRSRGPSPRSRELLLLDEPTAGMNPAETEDATAALPPAARRARHDHPAHRARHEGGHEHLRTDHASWTTARRSPRACPARSPSNPRVIEAYLGEGPPRSQRQRRRRRPSETAP